MLSGELTQIIPGVPPNPPEVNTITIFVQFRAEQLEQGNVCE